MTEEFEKFWTIERKKALDNLGEEENLDVDKLETIIGDYLFIEKMPLRDNVIDMMHIRPGLKQRGKTAERIIDKAERIIDKMKEFVETFISSFAA